MFTIILIIVQNSIVRQLHSDYSFLSFLYDNIYPSGMHVLEASRAKHEVECKTACIYISPTQPFKILYLLTVQRL